MATVALSGACLIALAIPLAETTAIRRSQHASASGNEATALSAAREAVRVEPGAADSQIQLALVYEEINDLPAAQAAAQRATGDEPANWSAWLILSRIEAESGHARAAVAAYRRARSLNPKSGLFSR